MVDWHYHYICRIAECSSGDYNWPFCHEVIMQGFMAFSKECKAYFLFLEFHCKGFSLSSVFYDHLHFTSVFYYVSHKDFAG